MNGREFGQAAFRVTYTVILGAVVLFTWYVWAWFKAVQQ